MGNKSSSGCVQPVVREKTNFTWSGYKDSYGKPHGTGSELDSVNNISGYGEYYHGQRVGTWQFMSGGKLVYIHEYDREAKLLKIISYENGTPTQLYSGQTADAPTAPTTNPDKEGDTTK